MPITPCLRTTTMSLSSLPTEVIIHITTFLFSDEIDVLAQTLNSSITPACLSLLGAWTPKARNARRMTALFGCPASWVNSSVQRIFPTSLGVYSPPQDDPVLRLRIHQLLDFSETLHWLPCETPDDLSTSAPGCLGWCAVNAAKLERAQQHLGFKVEPAFTLFMSSQAHQSTFNTVYSEDAYDRSFRIGPMIKFVSFTSTKLLSQSSGSTSGYACQFATRSFNILFE